MSIATELGELFQRDLTRLAQELKETRDADLWKTLPGVGNSIGNLAQHLEGNLREYVGRMVGGVDYARQRDAEFAAQVVGREELIARIGAVRDLVPGIVAALTNEQLAAQYPQRAFGRDLSTGQFLLSIYAHFNYHLGQIDYLRRILSEGAAVDFATL